MATHHPALPEQRPLVIAHRAGNSPKLAHLALEAGADMLETDVWDFRGRLEIRHVRTLGRIPLLWDRWHLEPGWRTRRQLKNVLEDSPVDSRLFLDLKGTSPTLGERIVELIEELQPERRIMLCGRTWPQLDALADHPKVARFYSVGDLKELDAVWARLDRMSQPALSLNKNLATPAIMERLNALGTTVICWTVNTIEEVRTLSALGVDGFTSDNLDLIKEIAHKRTGVLAPESEST